MELIVKLFLHKPSKIGVRYPYEHTAVKEYESLMLQNKEDGFKMKLEFVKDKMNLCLISENTGKKVLYPALNYKPQQIKLLQDQLIAEPNLQFVHVFPKKNILYIARPFGKEEFIAITHVEILHLLNS